MSLTHSYISRLGLNKLKSTKKGYNFRCPICGDSQSKPHKRSAYLLDPDSEYGGVFYCHKCRYEIEPSNIFRYFLREINYSLYQEYETEKRKAKMTGFMKKPKTSVVVKSEERIIEKRESVELNKWVTSLSDLSDSNPIKQYIMKRKIPAIHYDDIYAIDGNPYALFRKLTGSEKYKEDELKGYPIQGALFPFRAKGGTLIGFSIRAIDPNNKRRFLTLMTEGNDKFFFGEDTIDWRKKVYVVEGLIDRMSFEDNRQVLAMVSANPKIERIKREVKNGLVYIYDFEYNNSNLTRSINNVIKNGIDVVMSEPPVRGAKDINDLRKVGWGDKEMICFFDENVYNGLRARMCLATLSKQGVVL